MSAPVPPHRAARHRRPSRLAAATAAMFVSALVSAPLEAQVAAATATAASATPRQVLSVQPLQLLAGVVAGDYERVVRGSTTLGVGVSYWDVALSPVALDGVDATYVSAEAKARWYPDGTPFRGFSLAATAGVAHAGAAVDVELADERASATGAKVGVEIDYNWLVGRRQRMAVAAGVGGKRIFYNTSYSDRRFAQGYGTARLALGWAF